MTLYLASSKIKLLLRNSSATGRSIIISSPVAEFIDPLLGDKVNSGIGCRTGPTAMQPGVLVRQPYALSLLNKNFQFFHACQLWHGAEHEGK